MLSSCTNMLIFLNQAGTKQDLPLLVFEFQNLEADSDMHRLYLIVFCVSEAGVLVKTYVEKGMLVPDHVMTRLMLPRLEQLNRHSWLLDGKNIFNTFRMHGFYLNLPIRNQLHRQTPPSFVMVIIYISVEKYQPLLKSDWPPQVPPLKS